MSAPFHPDTHDFLYSRVEVGESVFDQLLNRDGVVLSRMSPKLVFRAYARTRTEVQPTVVAMRVLAHELQMAADGLEDYADEHKFKGDGLLYLLRRLRIRLRGVKYIDSFGQLRRAR